MLVDIGGTFLLRWLGFGAGTPPPIEDLGLGGPLFRLDSFNWGFDGFFDEFFFCVGVAFAEFLELLLSERGVEVTGLIDVTLDLRYDFFSWACCWDLECERLLSSCALREALLLTDALGPLETENGL